MCRELGSSELPSQEIWCHPLGQLWKRPVRELHSFPAGRESGHNKACFSVQAIPDPNFLQQLFALSTKISFKSQIFKVCVGSNDIVGNMDLHNMLFHPPNMLLTPMYLKKKTGHINATSLTKIKLGRFLSSLVKIEPKMSSDSNFYNLFVLPIRLIGIHRIYPAF